MTYDQHLRSTHRINAIRAERDGEADTAPPLPVTPQPIEDIDRGDLGPAPGQTIRFESAYDGSPPPTIRKLDAAGRFLLNGIADQLGWAPHDLLEAHLDGHYVVLRSAGRQAAPRERRAPHLDGKGRVVVPAGLRTYLATDCGEEVLVRVDAAAGTVRIADSSLLARALDLLDQVDELLAAQPTDPTDAADDADVIGLAGRRTSATA